MQAGSTGYRDGFAEVTGLQSAEFTEQLADHLRGVQAAELGLRVVQSRLRGGDVVGVTADVGGAELVGADKGVAAAWFFAREENGGFDHTVQVADLGIAEVIEPVILTARHALYRQVTSEMTSMGSLVNCGGVTSTTVITWETVVELPQASVARKVRVRV